MAITVADVADEPLATWEEIDEIVPLKPRPLQLSAWESYRFVAATAALLALLTSLVLLRPLGWGGLAGQQSMPAVAVLPRTLVAFIPLAMALVSALTVRTLVGIRHWASVLGVLAVSALGLEAGARVRVEASTLIAHHPTTTNARAFVALMALCGVGAEACAVFAALAAIGSVVRGRRGRPASALMAGAFLLPLVAYLLSLATPDHLTTQLFSVSRDLGTRSGPSSVMAYAVFEPFIGLIYLGTALGAWQAITLVQAINEAGPRATRIVVRGFERVRLRQDHNDRRVSPVATLRSPLVALVLVVGASAMLLFDLAGYSGHLRSSFGGDADTWRLGGGPGVWWFTALIVAPAGWLLLRRIRPAERQSLAVPLLLLSLLVSILGPVQVISQTLADVAPSLHLQPAAGQPLFVSLALLDWITTIGIAVGVRYYWRRNRGAAALFGIALLIHAPGTFNAHTRLSPPIASVGRLDLVFSAVMLIWSVGYLVRRSAPPPAWLISLWIGSSLLTHFTTLVPNDWPERFFALGAVLPLAYALLWAGNQLNELAEHRPAEAALSLCVMAMLLIILTAELWIGDRFGRDFNILVTDGATFQTTARQVIGFPLLAVLSWTALRKAAPGSRVEAEAEPPFEHQADLAASGEAGLQGGSGSKHA